MRKVSHWAQGHVDGALKVGVHPLGDEIRVGRATAKFVDLAVGATTSS